MAVGKTKTINQRYIMNKSVLTGLVSGLILGGIQMLLLNGGVTFLVLASILGALIGYLSLRQTGMGILLLSAVAGAIFYIVIAFQSGLWLDDIATGAITGLIIGLIFRFIGPRLIK